MARSTPCGWRPLLSVLLLLALLTDSALAKGFSSRRSGSGLGYRRRPGFRMWRHRNKRGYTSTGSLSSSAMATRIWCWATGDTTCRAAIPLLVEAIDAQLQLQPNAGGKQPNAGPASLRLLLLGGATGEELASESTEKRYDWVSDPVSPVW